MRGLLAAFALLLLVGCAMVQPPEEQPPAPAAPVIEPQEANIVIEFTRVPEEVVEEGETFVVAWYVGSDVVKSADQTALHYGEESRADVAEPAADTYPYLTSRVSVHARHK